MQALVVGLALAVLGQGSARIDPNMDLVLGRRATLLALPSVQKELRVTADQSKRLTEIFDGVVKVEGERVRVLINGDTDLPGIERDGLALLDDRQRTRLDEIWMQRCGYLALADEQIAKQVALTAVQRAQIVGIVHDAAKKLADVFGPGAGADAPAQARAARASAEAEIAKVLTESQRRDYSALKGKPFRPGPS